MSNPINPAGANAVSPSRLIAQAAERTGADFDFLMRTASRESGFDAGARAATSSAAGMFQFIEQTWFAMVARYGDQHGMAEEAASIQQNADGRFHIADPARRDAVLNLRFDPQAASYMAGELAAENLDRESVTHDLIESDSNVTGSVAVFVDHTGERSMVSGRGADFDLLPSEVPRDTVAGARHLHLTAWSFFTDPPRSAARTAAHLVQGSGGTLSFDPGSFQMIEEVGVDQFLSVTQDLGIDIFLPNKEEGMVLTGRSDPADVVRELDSLDPSALIVLKLDADGALVFRDGDAVHVPPAPTNRLVDATGAGDSFAGAFLARYLRGTDSVVAAQFANRVSAWVIEHPGARPVADTRLATLLAATS